MLSLWKLRVGAESYYLDQVAKGLDDYYSGAGETRGRWIGAASSALGLDGQVEGDSLRAVLAGLAPGTGLTPNGEQVRTFKNRVPGFDLTFSAPKSVSILYAFGDPLVRSEVIEATDLAVTEALAWLEREACFVRRGSNYQAAQTPAFEKWGTRRLPGRGFIASQFRHRTSRQGDPQLHSHVLVANLTQGPDGRWSALDGQALYKSKMAAGAVYRSVLRHELSSRLGVEWGPSHNGLSDIAGIPKKVLRLFSKRRVEIETELARTGMSGPQAAAGAALETRTVKSDADQDLLDARWVAEAEATGYGPGDIDELLAHGTGRITAAIGDRTLTADTRIPVRSTDRDTGEVYEELVTINVFAARIGRTLPATDAVVDRFAVQNAVADQLSTTGSTAMLERLTDAVLAHHELIPSPTSGAATTGPSTGWEQTWTTATLAAAETELVAHFTPTPASMRSPVAALDPALVDAVLSNMAAQGRLLGPDQADTVRRLTTQGLAVEAVVGKAGTGKTYTMNAVREVFTAAGYDVIGACPTARAARELTEGAGIEASTIDKLLSHATLTANQVVVIDEAGMVGTLKFHQLISTVRAAGAKAIVVGDPHQLPEIEAGGSFGSLLAAVGDHRCELTINRRQRHEWEHGALDQLRNGDVATFWKAYLDHDRVVLDEHQADVQARAVGDWLSAYRGGSNAYMLAGTRSETVLLNDLARAAALDAGMIHGDPIVIDNDPFQVGDRIVLTQNMRGQTDLDRNEPASVDNGMIATITSIDHDHRRIDIELVNGRRLRLSDRYIAEGHIAYGYATTFHKAQGLTCDDVYVVGPAGMYRESGYVALSRARNEAHLYATTKDAAAIGERGHSTGIALPTERADNPEADMVGTLEMSKIKRFAIDQNPNLLAIAELAHAATLGDLTARLGHINQTTARLRTRGHLDPTAALEQLHAAAQNRSRMHVGGRVNVGDRDNLGVIEHLIDTCGAVHVRFTSSDGQRTHSKTFTWDQVRPVDRPAPVELTAEADTYLREKDQILAGELHQWADALEAEGIGIEDHNLVTSAIEQRQRQLLHAIRATPPAWLRWWVGDRPSDPIGAAVYDEHLTELAAYRDTHHLDHTTPGYGPRPANPTLVDDWNDHLDAALTARNWLHTHHPHLDEQTPDPISVADAHARLAELATLFDTAPPDVARLIDDITNDTTLTAEDRIAALHDAAQRREQRSDWILEHWPNVIERTELETLTEHVGPLDHWPTPLPAAAQHLYNQLAASDARPVETRSLIDLDRARTDASPSHQARQLRIERDQNYRHIKELRTVTDPAGIDIAAQHLDRLTQRNADIKRLIIDAEHLERMADWGTSATPELDQAIINRGHHLADLAISDHAAWVGELIATTHTHRPDIDGDELHQLLSDVAAYRERAGHTGPDPLGPPPADSAGVDDIFGTIDPTLAEHRRLATTIEPQPAAPMFDIDIDLT